MDKIMYEDKKTKQVKVQYGVEASIDRNIIKKDKVKCYVWFDNEDYEED